MKTTFDYLPSGPQEKAWGLQVSGFGQGRIRPHQTYPPSGHPAEYDFSWRTGRIISTLQVVLISQGKGSFESSASGLQSVHAGDCFLILPGIWHRYRPCPSTGWTEHWLELSGRHIEEWLRLGILETTSLIFRPQAFASIFSEFQKLYQTAARMETGYRPIIAAQAVLILTMLLASSFPPSASQSSHNLQTTHRLLRQYMTEKLSMRDIARRLSLSYATFHRQFRSETGLSPKQYANQMRLAHARQLLSSTSLSLKEIANRLRYSSAFHFSRQFKLEFGIAPSAWRKLHGTTS